MANVAFIGLGIMGYPMAGYLAKAGHEVTVFNRTVSKADNWVSQYGGDSAPTPAQAAKGKDFVFACVGNDDDLRQVTTGKDGAFSSMSPNSVFVDHTTASANVAKELHSIGSEKGISFIDAPVSGGQAGAENGVLTVMCGGDEDIYTRAEPIINAYARSCKRLGEVGSGQLCKMVNQICIAGLVQALAEGLEFANKAGLDGRQVVDVISKGAAQSWQMENRFEWVLDGDYNDNEGFAVDWMRKDLGICLEEAQRCGAQLPVTALVDQMYARVQAMGGSRWDTSSLVMPLK